MIGGRVVRLSAGSLDTDTGVQIEGLRIDFEVVKFAGSALDTAKIEIYNLTRATRESFVGLYTKVFLEFGYGAKTSVLFVGQVYNVVIAKRSATDIVTTLYCGSGVQALTKATTHTAIPIGASMLDAVDAVLESVKGFGIDVGLIDDRLAKIKAPTGRGLTVSGLVRDQVEGLLEGTGFELTVEGDTLEIRLDEVTDTTDLIVTPASGLIGIPKRTNDGYDFTMLCNAAVRPGYTLGVYASFADNAQSNPEYQTPLKHGTGGLVTPRSVIHRGTNWQGQATTEVIGRSAS